MSFFLIICTKDKTISLVLFHCSTNHRYLQNYVVSLAFLLFQAYGRDLMEAQEWCRKYQRSGNVKDLTQAWDLYYLVFRRISKQLPQVLNEKSCPEGPFTHAIFGAIFVGLFDAIFVAPKICDENRNCKLAAISMRFVGAMSQRF